MTPTTTASQRRAGLGRSLQGLMKGIKAWAEGHMTEVLTHRGGDDQEKCDANDRAAD
ncbi:hypothetical protein [Streptomyces sp. NPDC056883]|uniref:hypothetical protein n=1 Tax=Streptomyces sp. NPDC056883 TaxID=3345959 RepID=UPI0036B5BA69